MKPKSGGGKRNAHSNFVRLRTKPPALGETNTTLMRAVVAAIATAATAAVAQRPDGQYFTFF